jgi:hypothetical protein
LIGIWNMADVYKYGEYIDPTSNIQMKLSYAILGGFLLASASANFVSVAQPKASVNPKPTFTQRLKNVFGFKPAAVPAAPVPPVATKLTRDESKMYADVNRMLRRAEAKAEAKHERAQNKIRNSRDDWSLYSDANELMKHGLKRYERANKNNVPDDSTLADANKMFLAEQKRYERAQKKTENRRDDWSIYSDANRLYQNPEGKWSTQKKVAAGVAGAAAIGAAGTGIAAASGAFDD